MMGLRANDLAPHPGAATLPEDSSSLGHCSGTDGLSLQDLPSAQTRPHPAAGPVLCSVPGLAALGAVGKMVGTAGGGARRGGEPGRMMRCPGERGCGLGQGW